LTNVLGATNRIILIKAKVYAMAVIGKKDGLSIESNQCLHAFFIKVAVALINLS